MSGRFRRSPRAEASRRTPCSSSAERPAFDATPFDPSSGRSAWEELPSESIFKSPPSRNESPRAWLSSPYPSTSAGPSSPSDQGACGMWAYPSTSGSSRNDSPGPSSRSTQPAKIPYEEMISEEEEIRIINEILAGGLLGDPRLPDEMKKHIPASYRGNLGGASRGPWSGASPLARQAMMNLAGAGPGSPMDCGSSSRSPYSSPRSTQPAKRPYEEMISEEEEIRIINEILAGGLLGDPRLPDEMKKHIPANYRGDLGGASPIDCGSSSRSPYSSPPSGRISPSMPGPSKRSTQPAKRPYEEMISEEEEIRIINEILAGGLLGDPRLPDEMRQHLPIDTSEPPPWVPSRGCPRLEDPNNPPPTFHPLLDTRWRTDPNVSEDYRRFLEMTASLNYHNETSPYQGIYEYGKTTEFNVHNLRDVEAFDVSSPSCGKADPDEVFVDPYEALAREVPSNVPEKKRKEKYQYFEQRKKLEMFKLFGMDTDLELYGDKLEKMQEDPWSGDEEDIDEWWEAQLGPGGKLKLFEKYCRKPWYVDEKGEPHVAEEEPPAPVEIADAVCPTAVEQPADDDACSPDDSFTTASDEFEFPRGFDPEFGQEMEFPGGTKDSKAFNKFIQSWAPVGISNVQDENSELNRTFTIPDPLTAGSDSDPCSDESEESDID